MSKPHGYVTLAFEDYRIPPNIWARLEKRSFVATPLDGPCWIWRGRNEVDPRMVIALRLGYSRHDILALVPTCGRIECANPAHTCLTLKSK